MEQTITIDWPTAMRLLGVIEKFCVQYKDKKKIDPIKAANEVASVFGIDDLGAFAEGKLAEGMDGVLEEQDAQAIAAIIAGLAAPVGRAIKAYVKGNQSDGELIEALQKIYFDNSDMLLEVLKQATGIDIPPEFVELMNKYSISAVTVMCFTVAYEIYCKAAEDARIAIEHSEEVCRMCAQASNALRQERLQMQEFVDEYLLGHLLPFESGIAAMDEAIVAGDDDGFIKGNEQLWELLGHTTQFHTAAQFDELMLSDDTFVL